MLAQRGDIIAIINGIADFRIQPVVIRDIITVLAAGSCLKIRRGINIADTQVMQVVHQASGVLKTEPSMKLQTVCPGRNSGIGGRRTLPLTAGTRHFNFFAHRTAFQNLHMPRIISQT